MLVKWNGAEDQFQTSYNYFLVIRATDDRAIIIIMIIIIKIYIYICIYIYIYIYI